MKNKEGLSRGEINLLESYKKANPRKIALCTREQQLAYAKKKYGENVKIICRYNGTTIYVNKQFVEYLAYWDEIEVEE